MASGGGEDGTHKDEEDIFGMDPNESLNFLSLGQMSRRLLKPQTSIDMDDCAEKSEEAEDGEGSHNLQGMLMAGQEQ